MTMRPRMREGVSASRIQVPAGKWPSLLDFLCSQFPGVGESVWRMRFQQDLVLDADGKALAMTGVCSTGMIVYYYRELPPEIPIPFSETILYQDAAILVVDKPHFLPVIPSGQYVQETLLVRLKKQLGIEALSPVHRIDKDTAGLVLFSRDAGSRNAYQRLFRERNIHKEYEAWAPILPRHDFPVNYQCRLGEAAEFFRTAIVAGESNSETRMRLLETSGRWARYQLEPVTGRKHQLRVHMASLGAPILNDHWYPEVRETRLDDFSQPLQLLAKRLAFTDPLSGEEKVFESRQTLWHAASLPSQQL